ncbi:MAG: GlsB/YeaQ/YmgE family stress response membrane protein [Acidimicrobiales bacterium]
MFTLLVQLLVIGLIAGALARFIVPGRDPLGCGGTILLGIVGSFVGGFLAYLLFDRNVEEGAIQPSGLFGSIVGAIVALLIWRQVSGRRR